MRRRSFRFRAARVTVEVRSPELTELVETLYPRLHHEGSQERADVVLRRDREGRCHVAVADGEWISEDEGGALVHLEHVVTNLLLARLEDLRVLHAGGFEAEGGAVLLPGDGGRGKSSLTAGMALEGHPVYGDDVVLLEPDPGRVLAFPRALRIREPASTILGLPPSPPPLDRLWTDGVFLDASALGSRWAEPRRVTAIVFPHRSEEEPEPELTPLSGGEAVGLLLAQLLFLEKADAAEFDLMTRLATEAPTWKLHFGKTRDALPVLKAAIDRVEAPEPDGRKDGELPLP